MEEDRARLEQKKSEAREARRTRSARGKRPARKCRKTVQGSNKRKPNCRFVHLVFYSTQLINHRFNDNFFLPLSRSFHPIHLHFPLLSLRPIIRFAPLYFLTYPPFPRPPPNDSDSMFHVHALHPRLASKCANKEVRNASVSTLIYLFRSEYIPIVYRLYLTEYLKIML